MAHRTTRANRPLNHRIETVPGKRIVQFYGQQVTLEDVEAARRYNRPL